MKRSAVFLILAFIFFLYGSFILINANGEVVSKKTVKCYDIAYNEIIGLECIDKTTDLDEAKLVIISLFLAGIACILVRIIFLFMDL